MSSFELNKIEWYEVQIAQANDFLNEKLTNEDYGIYYSVAFVGDAETYLMQAKTAPKKGDKYWGHLEKSKSGKSVRFKKDKDPPSHTPDGKPSEQSKQDTAHGDAITASMCVKLAFQSFISCESMMPQEDKHWLQIEYMSDMLYKTIKKTGKVPPSKIEKAPPPEIPEEWENDNV